MFNVEQLVSIVVDTLEAEKEYRQNNVKIRQQKGLRLDSVIWIPTLDGSAAYDMGVSCEKADRTSSMLRDICVMLDIDQTKLIAAVKSMQRKERHNGRWDNPCLTCNIGWNDKERLCKFLRTDSVKDKQK